MCYACIEEKPLKTVAKTRPWLPCTLCVLLKYEEGYTLFEQDLWLLSFFSLAQRKDDIILGYPEGCRLKSLLERLTASARRFVPLKEYG